MNELELQRLVDGEGDDQWRASLLTSLGDDATQWRELALQLLEDQRLKKHFRLAQRAMPTVTLAKESLQRVDDQRENEQRMGNQRMSKHGWSTAVLAASLLFLVIGSSAYYKRLPPSAEPTSGSGETPAQSIVSSTSQNETGLADPVPAGRVQWLASSSSDDVMETPVYAVSQVAPEMLLGEQAKRLRHANTRLNRQGWNANFDTKIYEGQMEDGRRMIVPVNVVRVEPLGY